MPPLTMAVLCLQDKLMTTLNHQINELTKLTFQIIFHETDKQYNILIQVKEFFGYIVAPIRNFLTSLG